MRTSRYVNSLESREMYGEVKLQGGDLEPEGEAGHEDLQGVLHALLHGAVHAHAGPVALPPQHGGHHKLEAIRAARLQLAAAQQLPLLLRISA